MERIANIEERLNNGGEKPVKEHKIVEVKAEQHSDDTRGKRARRTAE